jgi:NAD-dependent SIR2 family protein deacetylase
MNFSEQPAVALVGRDPAIPPPSGSDWAQAGPRMRAIAAARPGRVHERLRELRDAGRLAAVISDTDDVLLDEAGVVADVELRGSVRESVCPACGYTEPLLCLLEMLPEPRCAACGDALSPGTPPDPRADEAAAALVRDAGVLLLAGVGPDHPLARLAARTADIAAG